MAENDIVVHLDIQGSDKLKTTFSDVSKSAESNFKKTEQATNSAKSSFASLGDEIKTSFTSAIKGAVLAYAGFEVVNKVTGFFKEARLEYKESVQMQMQLKTALGYTSQALNEQADALGKKLIVDNEEITAVQIKLANYVKNEEQIKRLVPAVLDLAAATGMDMASAANMVARGIADDSEELGRFKVSVDGAKGSAERIDSVILGLNAKFLGQATAVASAKDSFDQYEVAMKNISEKVGKVVSEAPKTWFKAWYDLGRSLAGTNILEANKAAEVKKKELETQTEITRKEAERLANQRERTKLAKEALQKEQEKAIKIASETFPNRETFEAQTEWEKQELEKRQKNAIEYASKLLPNRETFEAQQVWRDKEKEEDKKSDDRKKNMAEMDRQRILQNQSYALGALASIFAGQKKYIAAYKTFAIAQALMDATASAIPMLNPKNGGPPPLNFIMAGITEAAGIAMAAKIGSQKFATGTAYQSGGMALVGENGPEYVNLPRGASVYNNTQTRNMTTNASMNVTIMDSSGNITETLRAQLRSGQGDQLVRDIQNRLARQI